MVRLRDVGHEVPVRQRHAFGQTGSAARVWHESHVNIRSALFQNRSVHHRIEHLVKIPCTAGSLAIAVYGYDVQRFHAGPVHQLLCFENFGKQLRDRHHPNCTGILKLVGDFDWKKNHNGCYSTQWLAEMSNIEIEYVQWYYSIMMSRAAKFIIFFTDLPNTNNCHTSVLYGI